MTIFILVGLCLVVLMAILNAPKDGPGKPPLISAYNLTLGLFVVYIIMPGFLILLNSGEFTWARSYGGTLQLDLSLIVAGIGLIAFIFGATIARRAHSRTRAERSDGSRRDVPLVVPIILICIGMLLKLYVVYTTGGIDAAILRLSSSAQEKAGIQDLQASSIGIRTLSGLADAGAIWLVVQSLRDRKFLAYSATALAVVLVTSYLTMGKRLALILPLIAIGLAVHAYRHRLTIKYAPLAIMGALGLGMASLLVRILLPASQSNTRVDYNQIDYARGSMLNFYFYSLEFSSVEMISVVRNARESILSMFGGPLEAFVITNIQPLAFTIPRSLWPGKPERVYDISYSITAILNGTSLDGAKAGYASSLVGTSYVYLGVLGVLIGLGLFGWITAVADGALIRNKWSVEAILFYALVLTIVFHLFRQGTLGWTFIVGIMQQYGTILGILILLLFRESKMGRDMRAVESLNEIRLKVEAKS